MEILLGLLFLVLLAGGLTTLSRLGRLRQAQEQLEAENARLLSHMAALTQRVYQLESGARASSAAPLAAAAAVPEQPASVALAAAASEPYVPASSAVASGRVFVPPAEQPVEPALPPSLYAENFVPSPLPAENFVPPPPYVPGPTLGERLRSWLGDDEWEAIVGGNLANKLGILILVVGIALFLGYQFGNRGPWGKVAMGLVISLGMLGFGIFMERRQRYGTFARGFLGGGWATLYFTVFAMHGLPAARVVESPTAGLLLLLAVALGMILHALRYRTETVTGLAFAVGFVTLDLFPSTSFSLAATLPLTVFLLGVAQRFGWNRVAVGGLVLAYGSLALQYDPRLVTPAWVGALVLWIYWLLFETFDIVVLRRAERNKILLQSLLPLNAAGMVGVALLPNSLVPRAAQAAFFTAVAAAYLASTVVRVRVLRGRVAAGEGETLPTGYRAALTTAATAAVVAIFQRFTGTGVNLALLLEGQLLILAGRFFGDLYLQRLGTAVLGVSVLRLLAVTIPAHGTVVALNHIWQAWSPITALTSAVLAVNRFLTRMTWLYSVPAIALAMMVITDEVPNSYMGLAFMLFAAVLIMVGIRRTARDIRWQGYGVALIGTVAVTVTAILMPKNNATLPVLSSATALCAAATAWYLRTRQPAGETGEQRWAMAGASSAAALFAAAYCWHALPPTIVALAWGALGLLLVEAGMRSSVPLFQWQGQLLAMVAGGRLFFANFGSTGRTLGISHRLITVLPVALLHYHLARLLPAAAGAWSRLFPVSRAFWWTASFLIVVLMQFELGRTTTVIGWALFCVALLFVGLRTGLKDLRRQSYVLAGLTFLRCWATNLYDVEHLGVLPARVLCGGVVVAAFYAAEFLLPRRWEQQSGAARWEDWMRPYYSLLATSLFSLIIWYEVSGRVLTMSIGLEGLLLLAAGFAARERVLRLSGLLLFTGCIGKLFLYDLRNLERSDRYLSFIILGLLLIGVSWIYTRFREQVQKLL